MILLLLAGCERDPSFFGYWDVASLRAGTTEEDADEALLAGFAEFTSSGTCTTMLSYAWGDGALTPDPKPDLLTFNFEMVSSVDDYGDFVHTWRKRDETYTLTLSTYDATSTFDVVGWGGSSATLTSDDALLPGAMDEAEGARGYVEIELTR